MTKMNTIAREENACLCYSIAYAEAIRNFILDGQELEDTDYIRIIEAMEALKKVLSSVPKRYWDYSQEELDT